MNLFLVGAGSYFMVEAATNIAYWWNDHHPWYFQAGRVMRLILGVVVAYLGVML